MRKAMAECGVEPNSQQRSDRHLQGTADWMRNRAG